MLEGKWANGKGSFKDWEMDWRTVYHRRTAPSKVQYVLLAKNLITASSRASCYLLRAAQSNYSPGIFLLEFGSLRLHWIMRSVNRPHHHQPAISLSPRSPYTVYISPTGNTIPHFQPSYPPSSLSSTPGGYIEAYVMPAHWSVGATELAYYPSLSLLLNQTCIHHSLCSQHAQHPL